MAVEAVGAQNTNDVASFVRAAFGESEGAIRLLTENRVFDLADLGLEDIVARVEEEEAWTSLFTYADGSDERHEAVGVWVLPEEDEHPENVLLPSMTAVHEDGRRAHYWFLAQPLDLRGGSTCEALESVMHLFQGESWDLECPLPGSNGWRIERQDETAYSVEEIAEAFGVWGNVPDGTEDIPDQVEDIPTINDALIRGDLDDALLARQIEITYSKNGRQTPDGRWKVQKQPLGAFITHMLTSHVVGEKDGLCYLQGAVVDGARRNKAVKGQDLLVLDLDTGESIERIRDRIQSLGLFAVIYTTHSHMKDVSSVQRDGILKWVNDGVKKGEPGYTTTLKLDHVKAFLLEVKKYQPGILNGLEFIHEAELTKEGVQVVVKHQPMPKFRVVLVLKETFNVAMRGVDQKEGITEWKERYAGAATLLNAAFDTACTDPCRLFYTPRHPADAPFSIEIIAGRALDIEQDVDRVPLASIRNLSVWDEAANALDGSNGKTYKTTNLKLFAKKYADRFEAASFLEDIGWEMRGPGSGMNVAILCPSDDAHSNSGDQEDKGTFACNASESSEGSFAIHCSHNGCSGMDRLDHLDLICQAVGIEGAMELKKWVPMLEGEEDEDPEPEEPEDATEAEDPEAQKALTGKNEAKRLIDALQKGQVEEALVLARRMARTEKIKKSDRDALLTDLSKKSGAKIGTLKEAVKETTLEIAKKHEGVYVDDELAAALEELNKSYAFVMTAGKARILELPKAGEKPEFMDTESWSKLLAPKKFPMQDSKGDIKLMPIAKTWMEWEGRKSYTKGVVFEPEGEVPGAYNMWQGFPVKPMKGDWSLLRNHIFENICHGQEDWFRWLMLWFAQMVQQPGRKLGSSVVIKGRKGTGKSTMFEAVMKCMGEHAAKVSQRDHLTGKFSGHQKGLIFMLVEEAVWGGDHSAAGVLKDMITSDKMMVEFKGIDATPTSNYMRLGFISNEDWVVPTTFKDERRFLVLEARDDLLSWSDVERNRYFTALYKQLENGGYAAMMHEFSTMKPYDPELGWNVLRQPPKTPWLAEQAVESAPAAVRWGIRVIEEGGFEDDTGEIEVKLSENEETLVLTRVVHKDFERFMMQHARHGAANANLRKRTLDNVFDIPAPCRPGKKGSDRPWQYRFPSLKVLRERIATNFGQYLDGAEEEED